MNVIHDEAGRRFEIETAHGTALLTYRRSDEAITFTHTEVPEQTEGQGIGAKLAKAGLEYARDSGLKVVPVCSFVASYIRRHPEYVSLVDPAHRSRVERR